MVEKPDDFSIGMVERDTGIGRDTLRVWERRYGFPEPLRNDKGERIYPEKQVRRLQRIRRLLDQGLRPGKLLALNEQDLDNLEADLYAEQATPLNDSVAQLLGAIRQADIYRLGTLLQQQYEQQGMRDFILKTVAPLVKVTGEAWAQGQLQIFQEHILSEQLRRFLKTQITHQVTAKPARIILATLPGETHTLGLLMVEAMLASQGVAAINLGGEVPMDQIKNAVEQFEAETLGITFSAAYPYKHIRPHLNELRDLLPADVTIWTGGEGVHRLRKLPDGVMKFKTLDTMPL